VKVTGSVSVIVVPSVSSWALYENVVVAAVDDVGVVVAVAVVVVDGGGVKCEGR
jgi:hypothetical protein